MNCDFQEDSYFYHHLRCQGENKAKEDLSWLTVNIDHKKQVDNATKTTSKDVVQPSSTSQSQPFSSVSNDPQR